MSDYCFDSVKMAAKTALTLALASLSVAQTVPNTEMRGEILYDRVKYGPEMELQHLYYGEFPTGENPQP